MNFFKHLRRSKIILIALPFIFACGNSSKITQDDQSINDPVPIEKEKEGNGSMTIGTYTEADQGASKDDQNQNENVSVEGNATAIEWLDFETAIDRNKKEKKFIFIDIYTDWCTWCKKMDANTFKNPDVINYIDQNFYAVKMNAESDEAIAYKEVLYEQKAYGKKKYNELAVNLLGGKMSFPSFVVLNKREAKRGVISGYQAPIQLINGLKYYVGK